MALFSVQVIRRTGFAIGLILGACSSVDFNSFRLPDSSLVRLPSMSAPVAVETRKPITQDDLVDVQGHCTSSPLASAAPVPEAGADPVTTPTNPATEAGGVGLGMTECDVVKRAGPPEKVDIGTNERAERTLVLTYTKNVRPGIYSFVAGRLVSIDRAPEPPAPPKPVKPAKPTKPAKPKTAPG